MVSEGALNDLGHRAKELLAVGYEHAFGLEDSCLPTSKDIPRDHKAFLSDGTEISATLGVVPILRELEKGKLQVIGTGFYITRYGLFPSARHVFDDIIEAGDRSGKTLRIFHDTGEKIHIRHVTKISIANQADIVMGQADNFLAKFPDDPLLNVRAKLTLEVPKTATKLVTFAYPRNKLLDFTDRSKPVTMFASRFDGEFVCVEDPPKYDEHQVETYQTTVPIEGGASGGPFFDEAGRVFAIARSSMDFKGSEHEGATTSLVTPLRHCLHLGLGNLPLSERSLEFRQIPDNRRSDALTIRDLAKYGHLVFDPKIA